MKWKKLEHNGILFPPDFQTKKIKIKINGEGVDLDIKAGRDDLPMGKEERYTVCTRQSFSKEFCCRFCKNIW